MLNKYTTSVQFLGGASGVTPTCHLFKHKTYAIMADCGIDVGPAGLSFAPKNIDAAVLTHPHADHTGSVLPFFLKNPKCPIYIPEGSRDTFATSLRSTHKITSNKNGGSQRYKEVQKWFQDNLALLNQITHLEKRVAREHQAKAVHRQRRGRTQTSDHTHTIHDQRSAERMGILDEYKAKYTRLMLHLGITGYSFDSIEDLKTLVTMFQLSVTLPKSIMEVDSDLQHTILDAIIRARHAQNMKKLGEDEVATYEDLRACIMHLTELTLGKYHHILGKRGTEDAVHIGLLPSGHLYTTTSAILSMKLGTGNASTHVVYSGDLGNQTLPDPYRKDVLALGEVSTENADAVIMEATYGDKVHSNRDHEMQKLDALIVDVIEHNRTLVFPVISLDRPSFVMYEIVTRLIKTGVINPDKVEFLYFGNDLESYLPKSTEVWYTIQKYFKALAPDRVPSLGKRGNKARIIFAGGGFLPEQSPAAAVLYFALNLPDTRVAFANYCGGEDGNAVKLLRGDEFTIQYDHEIHSLALRTHQKADRIGGFSGHPDQNGLIDFLVASSKTPKPGHDFVNAGTKVFVTHADPDAKAGFKSAISGDARCNSRKLEVVTPRQGGVHPIKTVKVKPKKP